MAKGTGVCHEFSITADTVANNLDSPRHDVVQNCFSDPGSHLTDAKQY